MEHIGKRIAQLRKEKNVKQEELAAYVGVSAQAVSKWENGGLPDTELLPRIADFFEITLDCLFGRDGSGEVQGRIAMALKIESAPEEDKFRIAMDYCWDIERALCYAQIKDGEIDGGSLSGYEKILGEKERRYSSKLSDHGMSRMSIAPRMPYFFLMPDPKEGGAPLLEDMDYVPFFSDLADRDFFAACVLLHQREAKKAFTPSLFVKHLGVSEDKAEKIVATLEKYGWIRKTQIEMDDTVLEVCNFLPSASFVALLVFAQEIINPFHAYTYFWDGRCKPYL